jgi:hypothetical protein
MNEFDTIVKSLEEYKQNRLKITSNQYGEFQHCWLIYLLEEKRYGQAFCDHFNIGTTTPLYWFKDKNTSERWILDNYIQ